MMCIKVEGSGRLFVGTFRHTLDSKNRFVVPAKVRSQLGDSVVVSKGFDGCLELRKADDFESFAQKMSALPALKAKTRIVLRQLLANAADLEIDGAGRILLPAVLLQEASIKSDITIIGVGNKYEIWDAASYDAQKKSTDATYTHLAESLEEEND